MENNNGNNNMNQSVLNTTISKIIIWVITIIVVAFAGYFTYTMFLKPSEIKSNNDNNIQQKENNEVKENEAINDITNDDKPTVEEGPKEEPVTPKEEPVTPKEPVIENIDYIEAYFLNSINNPSFNNTYANNDAFIFKTNDNKYILLDAGEHYIKENKTFEVINLIYNKLKELQKQNIVTIDYMIVSHMHYDHAGNVADILNDSRFNIKNLIFKRESIQTLTKEVSDAAVKNGKVNIIEVNKSLKEGASYTLNDNVKMYLFNLSDVFLGAKGCKSISYFNYVWDGYTDKSAVRDASGDGLKDYLYFNGVDYINNESGFKFSSESGNPIKRNDNNYLFSRFYVVNQSGGYTCNANTNSIVVVFQVKTKEGNKYIYLPSDIENNGYDPFGEYDSSLKTTIHGGIATYPYRTITSGDNYIYAFSNGNRLEKNTDIKTFPIAAEYLTAKRVTEKFSDIKGNITIYQESHHGLNNSPEAISLLGVNSGSTYSIAPTGADPILSNQFRVLRGQYYLGKSIIMYTGNQKVNGIKCTINGSGRTACNNY